MWANYHLHSHYCDGKNTLVEIAAHARNQILSLGFSSHAPLPFAKPWAMKSTDLDRYLGEVNQLRFNSPFEIYTGLEVDYIPTVISPQHYSRQLDYTIGSIHFVDAFDNGERWEIDGTHAHFLDGLHSIFKSNIKAALLRYFELTREMLTEAPPAIVGHLDKIKMQNIDGKLFDESKAWYRSAIADTLKALKKSGAILEVNTRGVYQKLTTSFYPSPWVLQAAFELDIPVTISSDAHHYQDLTNHFSEAAVTLLQIGYKKISILSGGKWKLVPFDAHGIISS